MLAIVVPIMFDAAEKSGIIGNIYYVLRSAPLTPTPDP